VMSHRSGETEGHHYRRLGVWPDLSLPFATASGPVWKAVRASAPFRAFCRRFLRGRRVLVDGGIADNVPLEPMAGLKRLTSHSSTCRKGNSSTSEATT
jgi:hypothetical protein